MPHAQSIEQLQFKAASDTLQTRSHQIDQIYAQSKQQMQLKAASLYLCSEHVLVLLSLLPQVHTLVCMHCCHRNHLVSDHLL
jgi:hypothetical protein